MIVNKINIEGVCTKEELKKISFKDSNILNKDLEIIANNSCGIKDILEIALDTNIVSSKLLEFNDENIISITIETSFDILAIENIEYNTLSAIRKKEYFNYSFKARTSENDIDKVTIKIVDCYFKLINDRSIIVTLTYLINENTKQNMINNSVEKINYKLIDICKEFA